MRQPVERQARTEFCSDRVVLNRMPSNAAIPSIACGAPSAQRTSSSLAQTGAASDDYQPRIRVPVWNDCATLARVESPCRSFTIGRRSGSWPQAHPLASRSKLDSLGVSAESTRKRVRDEDPTQPLLCRCLLAAALNDCFSAVAERAVSLQRAQTRGHGITVRCPQCGERHAWTRAPRHRGKVGYHTPLESARHFSDRTSRKSKPSGFWSCGGQF